MSTMKSFLTTLDLVMRDKVEPETVVEEDEIEETLTINEDGELEFYEAVDPKTIPVWNPRKGGGRTGQKPPLK